MSTSEFSAIKISKVLYITPTAHERLSGVALPHIHGVVGFYLGVGDGGAYVHFLPLAGNVAVDERGHALVPPFRRRSYYHKVGNVIAAIQGLEKMIPS